MAKRKTKPIVAVVGRPNVGKSTLFNALAGENISIVKDTPGITRDRIYADIHWLDMTFTLIDTGGIEPDSKDVILSQMREQAEIAMETADVIIFLVDVKQGLVDADSKVADMLRRSHKPVVLVVNKVDSFQKYMADVYEFYNLGIGDPHPISAVNRLGIGDMLEAVTEYFDKEQAEEEEDDRTRVAIVGKPNVGKSSLINKLLGFLAAYIFIFAASFMLVSLDGFDMVTNFTSIAATLNNIGPGLNQVGPMMNFGAYSNFAKLVLIFDMLAGRLEIFPMLVLFLPDTWRRF